MKKLLVLAMMATLLMAGSAFAIDRHLTPAPNATFSFGSPGVAFGPTTTNNDDSCDISVAPAATLLLPYFEVDVSAARSQTTLFTITNVSRLPQIAHVTVWTDFSFPVLDFNIYLTGYDVQGINLMDVFTTGLVGSLTGTGPTQAQSPLGSLSAGFLSNPNFATAGIGCGNLPGQLPQAAVTPVRTALTAGIYPGCGNPVGRVHANAIGYITIDVAASCTTALPNDPAGAYFTNAGGILYDNVLIGDYQQLGPAPAGGGAASFDAGGNPMVHIRAVPEGGAAGGPPPGTNLPFTYYDRYTPAATRTLDRRQPLPSTFAARYIQGGTGAFATNYKIWREGFATGTCATLAANGVLTIGEIVRFDEHENPFISASGANCSPALFCGPGTITLPETSATNTSDTSVYPTLGSGDVGGWMYLNLTNGGSPTYSVTPPGGIPISTANPLGTPRASQNWVIIEMFGNAGTNRLTVDFDAAWLGNGCSPQATTSTANGGAVPIGPAGGVLVCPPGSATASGAPCTGTNTTPLP